MADSISVRIDVDGAGDKLRLMLTKADTIRGWLNRVAYPLIIESQRMRWVSENATEGGSWRRLNPVYQVMKLRKFQDYPGGGRKMMIATGNLADSITGDNPRDHFKLVSSYRLETGSKVTYAKYANEDRNFSVLGQNTIQKLKDSLREYLQSQKKAE